MIKWLGGMLLVLVSTSLAGQTVVNHNVPVSGSTSYPFVSVSQVMTWWVPSQLGNPTGPQVISEFGFQFGNAVNVTFSNVTIYLGETTVTQTTMNTTFDNNWFPATKTLVYQGPIQVTTTAANQHWRVVLQTPFTWSATRGLMVHVLNVGGAGVGTGTVANCADFATTQTLTTRLFAANTTSLTGSTNPACTYGASFLMTPPGPNLATSVTTLPLGPSVAGTAGTPVQYTVQGGTLTGPTTITAPTGIEVSLAQASGFGPSVQIPTFPSYPATPVYARAAANAAVGPVTGNITHESAGATTKNVAVTGDVVSLLASVPTLNAGFTTIGTPSTPVSYDLTGDGLVNATVVTVPAGYEIADSAAGPWGPTLNIATTPSYQQTVYVRLDGMAIGNFAGDVVNTSLPATVNIPIIGDVMPPDNLHTLRMGPNASILVDNNSQGPDGRGLVVLDFTMSTINSPWTGTDITFAASGTADEQAGISSLILYEDHPVNGTQGVFDGEFVDTIATPGPGVSFNGPNGTYTATLSNTSFPVMTTRRFFLVARLAGKAVAGETMHVEVQNVVATGPAGQVTGVPTAHPSDALVINAAKATLSLSGPVVFQTVDNNAQGPNGDGIPVCVFRFIPTNDSWNVSSFTFTESGTMDAQADISSLALYIDNGNGQWDGPATDLLATAAAGVNFNGPDGVFTAGLTAGASTFTVNQSKRFILVAKLSGTASTGETLRVSVSAIVQSAPTGGTMVGVPSGATSALMIDQPTLTVNAGPANPTTITREKSAAGFAEMIGQIRLSARNSAFTVAGMTLHTAGNGDWLNHLDPATGVQVFRDNGNGSFDAGDILLSSNPGATPSVTCTFSTNQNIAVNTDVDLWVVLNVLPSAGGSPFETFQAMIESASDINSLTAGGTVKLGTLAPETGVLRVVDFSVDEFTPTVGLFAGGASIKIEGSGFALPVTVTIGGVPCTGTATVDAGGTLISGLSVPSGTGSNLAIVLTTNNLPPKTLTQTFRYSNILPNPNTGGTTKPADGGSCAAAPVASLATLALPMLAMTALRRRRK